MENTYTLSVFTEDKIGLLNRITIIFTRRHINIESITASESEVKGIYRYTADALKENELFTRIVNENHAKILSISPEYIVVEKTGDEREIKHLFNDLEKFGMLEFVRSGRVAITKPMKTLTTFLKEVENNSKTTVKHFNN